MELGKQEEALAPFWVCARIPSDVTLDLSTECCGRTLTLLHKVAMAGVCPVNSSF